MVIVGYAQYYSHWVFTGINGEKVLAPCSDVIVVNDGISMTFKSMSSRSTIGYLVF